MKGNLVRMINLKGSHQDNISGSLTQKKKEKIIIMTCNRTKIEEIFNIQARKNIDGEGNIKKNRKLGCFQ